MPVVAQISVNFATRFQIESNSSTLPTSVRCVTPRSLTEYLLNSREIGPTAITNTAHMNYSGGFITAGDKINVKHNDFQLRQNLDVEQSLFVDSIYARRKGNSADTYQIPRTDVSRKITLAPFTTDLTNANSLNYIDISTSSSSKSISLFINHGSSLSDKENSINIFNDNAVKQMTLKTGSYVLSATDIKNFGPIYNSSTVEIEGETTITDRLKITGNFDLGPSYNRFNVNSSSGNVSFVGSLTINTDRFTVNSSTGNTAIAGTLSVTGNTSIVGTTTLSNSITFNNGNTTSLTRRITGVRRLADISEFNGTTYDNDAITVGDVKLFGFKSGMIMMWSVPTGQNLSTFFNINGVGVGIMSGWQICNGQNGSPDLTDRFIVGAGNNYNLGDRDGANAVALNVNQIPAHNHNSASSTTNANININISGNTEGGGAHTHGIGQNQRIANTTEVGGNLCNTGEQSQLGSAGTFSHAGNHTHPFSGNTSFTLYARGGGQTHENRPPFHALYYIIKT